MLEHSCFLDTSGSALEYRYSARLESNVNQERVSFHTSRHSRIQPKPDDGGDSGNLKARAVCISHQSNLEETNESIKITLNVSRAPRQWRSQAV